MNPHLHAVRAGLGRGWIEFLNSLRSPQDLGYYLFFGSGVLIYLLFNRNTTVEGTELLYPAVALPGILGALIAFGAYIGPMYALAVEREDGTLLRAKATPHGMTGYVSGQVLFQSASALPMLAILIIPGLFLFDGFAAQGLGSWLAVLGLIVLGLLAVLPIGIVVGSLIKSPNKIGTWGMLPMIIMFGISGIFFPLQALWGWVQVVAQFLPMYWLGLGMRSALLPGDAVALEIGESWRTLEMIGVLGAWAIVGLLLTPIVLRRVARRQSGSAVEAGKQRAMQMYQ
ncbi:ABC transporter permease [Hoyosella rhizosphaerae]|uniref:Transport permease protein n=1 Tax=Hoyosella rhizosphaerae TaxID=1755582 RepID=A0A916U8F9_9ACTN|nr:ABC transporter permease [Hoyosella rhizosphaerae]MBN4927427.1 ABC transporter permease [Hoyosella rhizosphaerae]GGC64493.1 transport permease protein [Hoyosella rhizosphaerae]